MQIPLKVYSDYKGRFCCSGLNNWDISKKQKKQKIEVLLNCTVPFLFKYSVSQAKCVRGGMTHQRTQARAPEMSSYNKEPTEMQESLATYSRFTVFVDFTQSIWSNSQEAPKIDERMGQNFISTHLKWTVLNYWKDNWIYWSDIFLFD